MFQNFQKIFYAQTLLIKSKIPDSNFLYFKIHSKVLKSNCHAFLASNGFEAYSNIIGSFAVIWIANLTAFVENVFCVLHFLWASIGHHLCQSHCAFFLEFSAFNLCMIFQTRNQVFFCETFIILKLTTSTAAMMHENMHFCFGVSAIVVAII